MEAIGVKPGASVVIVDPDPVKDRDRGGRESTSEEKMRREAAAAGLEIVRVETFLERDNIFILRVGQGQEKLYAAGCEAQKRKN